MEISTLFLGIQGINYNWTLPTIHMYFISKKFHNIFILSVLILSNFTLTRLNLATINFASDTKSAFIVMEDQFGQNTINNPLVSTAKHRNSGDFETDPKRPRLEKTYDSKINPILITPQYDTFQHLIAVAEPILETPQGVFIDEDRGHIYMADCYSDRIKIFSETGDVVNYFHTSYNPYGVLIVEDRVYVMDWGPHKLSMYSIPDYQMISQVGELGSGSEQFDHPQNLSLSPDKHIYVADCDNNRLQILDVNLSFKGRFQHPSMTNPVDVKFSHSQLFVLTKTNPCLHIFTLSKEFVRSIITRGPGLQTRSSYFFCLDAQNNIVISDYSDQNIKVFSSEGRLLHIIDDGAGFTPQGVAILKQTKLVSVSHEIGGSSRLAIFFT